MTATKKTTMMMIEKEKESQSVVVEGVVLKLPWDMLVVARLVGASLP